MIESPVLIIGCPRSGTTLLYNILSEMPSLWSIGYESKAIIERDHHPSAKGWKSGALDANDLTDVSRGDMLAAFEQQAAPGTFWREVNQFRQRLGKSPLYRAVKRRGKKGGMGGMVSSAIPQQGLDLLRGWVRLGNLLRHKRRSIRLLEKTPENCLRLPFLLELFPDARVIYLTRDGRPNIHSLMEGWRQAHAFPGYRVPGGVQIPGDRRGRWAFTLIPGWRELVASPLEEVCAWQWVRCNQAVLEHRQQTGGRVPYLTIRYEEMIAQPGQTFRQVADFLDLNYEENFGDFANGLPRINVVSEPDPDKWRRVNGEAIARVQPIIQPMMQRLGYE